MQPENSQIHQNLLEETMQSDAVATVTGKCIDSS